MTRPRDEVTEWLYLAGEDLQAAVLLCKEGIYSLSCFHAQQCAEKAFKGFIICRGGKLKKIHDLNELVEICSSLGGSELKEFAEEMAVLNMFYAPMRYPDAAPGSLANRLPHKKDAEEAISSAEKVYSCVMKFAAPKKSGSIRRL